MRTRNRKRREEALERQEAYAKLTPHQKLKKLDAKLGPGVGAVRERARLQQLITKHASVAIGIHHNSIEKLKTSRVL